MSDRPNTAAQPVSLSARRERAQAGERRVDYLARAFACRDMAARTRDAHDAQFLRAMTIVWQILADKGAGMPNAARRSGGDRLPSGLIG